jgi:serralysin
MLRRSLGRFLVTVGFLSLGTPAQAAFHLWQVKEVYSNADGSIQYIELFNSFNNEQFATGAQIVANSDGVSRTFTFDRDLTPPTSNRHLLIATPGFASLPGAPVPDFTLPCGPFFDPAATTISVKITAPAFGDIDSITFAGATLPTDGTNSLTDTTLYAAPTLVSSASSPTNYGGTAAAMTLSGCLQNGACDACDDQLFCNGIEYCSGSACVAGPGCIGTCDEGGDTCDLFDLIFADGFEG